MKDNLGTRMKEFYENPAKTKLIRRTPVIIRVDGRAFHTFTRGFEKPYDKTFHRAMKQTARILVQNLQGCKLAYTQSDEISLLLTDYDKLESGAWFDYEVQKVCSIAAASATLYFNQEFSNEVSVEWTVADYADFETSIDIQSGEIWGYSAIPPHLTAHEQALQKGAMFDARCFNIPKEEVANYFYWRQLDATRNSIQLYGQANFSHKELQNKSCNDIKEMLSKKEIFWDNLNEEIKHGSCVYYDKETHEYIIDNNIPVFKGNGREYIERFI